MPHGWREAPRPILILAPAGRTRPERRAEYLDALSRLRIPLLAKGSELWAVRDFDAGFLVALAQLADPRERAAFRAAIDPSQTRLFDQQLAVAEAAVLDDLVGRRDEEGVLALDVDALSSLHPLAHHLAVGAGSRGAPLERPLAPAPAGAARRGDRRAPPAPALRARRMLLGAAAVAAQLDGRAKSGAGLALRERPHLAGGAGAAGGRARRPADDDRRRPARARQAAHPGAPSAIRGVAGAVGGSESGVRQGAGRVARPGTAVDHRRALAAPARAGRMAAARLQGLPPRPRADRAVRRARSAGRLLRARDAGGGRDRRRVHLTSARTRNPAA